MSHEVVEVVIGLVLVFLAAKAVEHLANIERSIQALRERLAPDEDDDLRNY